MFDVPSGSGAAEPQKLHVHFLGGQPLLFDEQRQCLYAADRTVAFVLCCLQEGMDIDAIERKLAAAASLSPTASRQVVQEALAQLRNTVATGIAAPATGPVQPLSGPTAFSSGAGPDNFLPAVAAACHIAIAGIGMRLACSERALAQRVMSAFAHLAVPDEHPPRINIDIQATAHGYVVFQERDPVLRVREIDEVTPALKAYLVQQVLARDDYRLAVHAAALARNGRVLLLPGTAGSGKSTLTAALLARGFAFLGDDTVLLDHDLRVRGLPFALAVKAGAWDLLKPYHPSLFALPVDRRPDGRVVRYLRPSKVAEQALPAAWMVFPSWEKAPSPGLTVMSRVDALRRFLPGCYASARRLGADEMTQLIAWIEQIDCYTLDSSDLPAAIASIERICG
jgi:hypothetical protein